MYNVSKASNNVFIKSRLIGLSSRVSGLEQDFLPKKKLPNGSTTPPTPPCADIRLTEIAPKLVFYPTKGKSKYHKNNKHQNGNGSVPDFIRRLQQEHEEDSQQELLPEYDELIDYLQNSWSSAKKVMMIKSKGDVSRHVYKASPDSPVPDFVPCNYEMVWANFHYHNIVRAV